MRFWDASAIIPLCLHERQTAALRKLAQDDEAIAAWWSSPVECLSALARLRREDLLSVSEEGQAQAVLRALMGAWTEVEPSGVVREQAGRVLRLHPCGQPMHFSWQRLSCGVREIRPTTTSSVLTNDYERRLGARGSISFHGGSRISFRINLYCC